jgi:hypothetical protein
VIHRRRHAGRRESATRSRLSATEDLPCTARSKSAQNITNGVVVIVARRNHFVPDPGAQIMIHSLHGPASERKGASAPTLAGHLQLVELQSRSSSSHRSATSDSRAPVSMGTNKLAVSRRSSNDRTEQVARSLRMVSSGMTGTGRSSSFGGRIRSMGLRSISPTSSGQRNNCLSPGSGSPRSRVESGQAGLR